MSFASDQLARIESLIARAGGLKSVNVDGVNVSFDDLISQRRYWQEEVERENGGGGVFIPVVLGDE